MCIGTLIWLFLLQICGDIRMRILSFLTDFGTTSGYIAQMKAVALSITQPIQFVDISHSIPAQNIHTGAFVLQTTAPFFPRGTVHVAVVDPSVGSNRKALVIITKSQILIGPDNGLLLPTAHRLGDFVVYEIANDSLYHHPISATFHGRDIFTPVAAHILKGLPFNQIGPKCTEYVDFRFPEPKNDGGSIHGVVLYVDDFGNIITNITKDMLITKSYQDKEIMVVIKGKVINVPLVHSYDSGEKGSLLALFGSQGFLEFSINQGNAAYHLNVSQGAEFLLRITSEQ